MYLRSRLQPVTSGNVNAEWESGDAQRSRRTHRTGLAETADSAGPAANR